MEFQTLKHDFQKLALKGLSVMFNSYREIFTINSFDLGTKKKVH